VYAKGIVENFVQFLSDPEVSTITISLARIDAAARAG
jgi:hypothetical protein